MHRFLLSFLLIFIGLGSQLRAADYYWVGNSGDWTNLTNWGIASGSTLNHTTLPGINDNVYFDNNSFSAPNQIVNIPMNVSATGDANIGSLTFLTIGNLQPTIQGAVLKVHGDITLGQNVRILSEFYAVANTRSQDIKSRGGYFRHFYVSGSSFSTNILDSLSCGILQLMSTNFNAVNVVIRADSLRNLELLTNFISPHFVDFSGSLLILNNLDIKPNIFIDFNFLGSSIYMNGSMKICGGINLNNVIINEFGIIDNRQSEACTQAGFAPFTIDSLLVNENAYLEVLSDSTDRNFLKIGYVKTAANSHLILARNVEVSYFEINSRVDVLLDILYVEQLFMKKSSELILAPTSGNDFRMRVISDWEIDGECSDRIYVRSSEYGYMSRIDVPAFMLFSYAQIVDIDIFGAEGSQQIENSIKAGKTTGLQINNAVGKKYYWIGNEGQWNDPNHWSMTDGGAAGTCVPGILDTVIFTNNSFNAPGFKVTTGKSSLFVRHFDCANNNVPFEFEGNNTRLYIIGTALFRNNIHFSSPTSIHMVASANTGELLFTGKQNIYNISVRGYTTFNFNLDSDSLIIPNCELEVFDQVSLVTTGKMLQVKEMTLHYVESSISLEEFRLEKLYNLGDSDNVFNSLSTIIYVSDLAEFYGAPVSISSLRYSGKKGCFINLFDRLDTIRYERPASFFTFTDTIILPSAPKSFWVFINELGLPGVSRLKGIEVIDGLILGDVDFRDCEFDALTVAMVKKMTLSGDLRINNRFSNSSTCNNFSYFTINKDSMNSFYQLYSDADSLVFNGFHIYTINAVGNAKFIALNGKDMGNNFGWTFRNQIGRKYFWIGKTGNYMQNTNWSLTSNGSPTICIPTLLDTVIFDRFSFTSLSDTVFLPSIEVPVRSWIVESDVVGKPVFHSPEFTVLYVVKDFKQFAPTTWSNPVRVSFLTSNDTSRISNKYSSPNVILAMWHLAIFNRYMLEDTLRVGHIWMGFGTFLANEKPIYIESFVADTAAGYLEGEVAGFSNITNTYMEVDRLNAFQKLGTFGFLRGRANMNGTRVQCRSFNMSFKKGEHPRKVEFFANIDGIIKIGEDGFHGGRIDSIIAHGNLKVLSVDSMMPPGYLNSDYLIVDGFLDAHAPLKVAEAYVNNSAYFKTFHDFDHLYLTKNKIYEFDPLTMLKYGYIDASSSQCEPITIIGKKLGQKYTIQKNQGGIFKGQGVIMRDCISGGGVSYMGSQATDLGNNVDWIVGRPPTHGLTDLSQDFILCENDSVFISPQTLYANGLKYTWKINNNEFDPGTFGFFLNKTGLYTLEVKYTDNCSLFDTAIVDVFTKNRLELGMDTILCQGETVHLKPIVESDWSFTWSTGSSRPDVYINKSGIVWLKVMNAKGCSITDSVEIGFFLKPKNPAGLDTLVCSTDNYLTGNVHKGFSYEWNTGDITPKIPVGNGGTFTLKMGNGICYVEDTVIVTVNDPVYFSIGSDTILLEGASYTLTPDKDLPNYYWNTGDSTKSITVNQDGLYILETRKGACETFDSAWVRFRKMPNVYFEKDTIFLCEGETTDLRPIVSKLVLSYLWNTGSTDSLLLQQSVGGMYVVEVKDSFFTNSDSIYLFVQDSFNLDIGNDTSLCIGEKLTIQSNEVADTYIWNTGATSAQIEVDSSGMFILEIEKGYCKAEDSVYVEFQPVPFVNLLDDTLVCEGEIVSININKQGYSYNWNDGNTSSQRNITQAGTYSVTVSQGVCQADFSTKIIHQEKPEFNLGNDTAICDNIPLFVSAQRSFAKTYLWENGFDGPNRTITDAGLYGVYIFDGICEVYDEIEVSKLKTPIVDIGSDTSICKDEIHEIIPTVSQTGLNYLWSDGTSSDRLTVYDTGTYILEVNNGFCFASDTILIYSCDCNIVYVPTAFSPNGDGLNDGFKPSECLMGAYKLQVFNRWGQMVFESSNPQEEWDGTNNGNECPGGAYLYKLYYNALYDNGARNRDFILTGTVNLVR